MHADFPNLLTQLVALAEQAGDVILRLYHAPVNSLQMVRKKSDHSPVTDADIAANQVIVDGLARLTPDIPIISEELPTLPDIDVTKPFWLVDPLDGTRSFVRHLDPQKDKSKGEFCVLIALIVEQAPVLGVIHIPLEGRSYAGILPNPLFAEVTPMAWRQEKGSDVRQPIAVRATPQEGMTAYTSRFYPSPHMDAYLEQYPVAERLRASSAIKFCRVAEGAADFYPRLGPTMEWDSAAGQAIVEAAGGSVTTLDGAPFRYGKPDYRNDGFLVWGRKKP